MTLEIHALSKPVIAAINGPAVGIGATTTPGMDIRMASTTARIGFVLDRLGIVPEACSPWFLPRIIGLQQALEWVYSAEVLTVDQALAGRLMRSVHEPDDLLPAAYELARSFVVGRSPGGARAGQLLHRNGAATEPLEAHLSDSLAMFGTSIGDGREGVATSARSASPGSPGGPPSSAHLPTPATSRRTAPPARCRDGRPSPPAAAWRTSRSRPSRTRRPAPPRPRAVPAPRGTAVRRPGCRGWRG